MKLINITLKDIQQIFRDRNSFLFLLAMPIVFTFFMGFAYRGGDNTQQEKKISLAWVQQDATSQLAEMLLQRLDETGTFEIMPMSLENAEEQLQIGNLAAILAFPEDFDTSVQNDQNPQIKLIVDSNGTTGQSIYQLLRVPLTQLMSAAEIARLSAELTGDNTEYTTSLQLAWDKRASSDLQSLIKHEQAIGAVEESWYGDNPYNQASPGIIVQFAILSLVTTAQILVQERKTRTLQRQLTTAMRPWEIIAGHMLAMFGIVLMQTLLMIIFGQLALHVDYFRVPLGTILLSIALSLCVAALGLLIGVFAESDNQVVLYSMLAMFVFSALGGTWFPVEAAGNAFRAISRVFPSTWAMIGMQNILIRGLDIASLWQPILILVAYSLGFFLLGVWRFRKAEM